MSRGRERRCLLLGAGKGPALTQDPDEQVDHLLGQLEARGDLLPTLVAAKAVTLDLVASVWVRCELFATEDNPSGMAIASIPYVPLNPGADLLLRLGRLRVDFRVDLEVPEGG